MAKILILVTVPLLAVASCRSKNRTSNGQDDVGIRDGEDATATHSVAVQYVVARSSVQALDSTNHVVWQHPTQLPVFRVHVLGSGDVVFAETGKGGGGVLWCLSPGGEVRWKDEGRMWVVGIDKADNILVNGGRPGSYFARLFSREGDVMWGAQLSSTELGNDFLLPTDESGRYAIPSKRSRQPSNGSGRGDAE